MSKSLKYEICDKLTMEVDKLIWDKDGTRTDSRVPLGFTTLLKKVIRPPSGFQVRYQVRRQVSRLVIR